MRKLLVSFQFQHQRSQKRRAHRVKSPSRTFFRHIHVRQRTPAFQRSAQRVPHETLCNGHSATLSHPET